MGMYGRAAAYFTTFDFLAADLKRQNKTLEGNGEFGFIKIGGWIFRLHKKYAVFV